MVNSRINLIVIAFLFSFYAFSQNQDLNIGLNAKVTEDGEILFDGTNKILHSKWTYWEGPRLKASLPIKWELVNDPINKGMVLNTFDSAAIGGAYGTADIVTKKKYKDFRLHIEFLIKNKGGNSGVYLQNRYEIQIKDGDSTKHGLGAVINEKAAPYSVSVSYTHLTLPTTPYV